MKQPEALRIVMKASPTAEERSWLAKHVEALAERGELHEAIQLMRGEDFKEIESND